MCFSSRNSHGGKHIFSISSLEAVFPPPAGKLPRHPLRARLGQKISNRKLSVISLYYGRWQYYALGGAGDPGGILRLFLRLRDRILFPEPDPSEKPRGGRRHVRRPGAGHVGKNTTSCSPPSSSATISSTLPPLPSAPSCLPRCWGRSGARQSPPWCSPSWC